MPGRANQSTLKEKLFLPMVPFNGLIYDLRDTWYILDFMVLPQGFQNARITI